jgi:prepilin-type N-terminal cleavage/methylation domain-containing protein
MRMRRGITLIEILIVVTLLGIAGALVIPSMAQVGVLRIQSALRTIVSDLTFAQSDALAAQARRVIVFGVVMQQDPGTGVWNPVNTNRGYTVFSPPPGAAAVDMNNDWMPDPDNPGRPFTRDLSDPMFGGAAIQSANFDGVPSLIFDELGGPVMNLTGDEPGAGGFVRLISPEFTYDVRVEPYTGRVTVVRVAVAGP